MGQLLIRLFLIGGRNCSNLAFLLGLISLKQMRLITASINGFPELRMRLNNLEREAEQSGYLAESVQFAQKTYDLSKKRYFQGLTNYLEVVESQKAALDAERSFIELARCSFYVHCPAH